MATFESPISNKNFSAPAMREFDVPDESQYMEQEHDGHMHSRMPQNVQPRQNISDLEREVRSAQEARKTGKERLNEGAKKRIEMLIGMTRMTREVDIEGNTFVLRTLKSKEMREALFLASQFDGTVHGPYEIRKQLLSRSLTHIAGIDVDQFLGSTTLDTKFAFIDELDESVSQRLYDEYVALSTESRNKYSMKTSEEIREVVDDIKK